MKTENLNITSETGGTNSTSEKTSGTKKIVGNAAAFAGAAGLGAAGAMAANAMGSNDKDEIAPPSANEEPTESPVAEEPVVEPVEFNPNDIMIDDGDEVILDESTIESPVELVSDNGSAALDDELQPIIGEQINELTNDVAMIDVDDVSLEPDDSIQESSMDIIDDVYAGPDEFESCNESDTFLADSEFDTSEPDILNDILNA